MRTLSYDNRENNYVTYDADILTHISSAAASKTIESRKTFHYPNCWQNNREMKSLFAPFSSDDASSVSDDAKLRFWHDMIVQFCQHKGEPNFCKAELQIMFARGPRVPQCLDTVLADLLRAKKIRKRTEYEYDPANSWTGWALTGLLWRPLSWGLDRLGGLVGMNNPAKQGMLQFIHLDMIQKFCEELEEQVLGPRAGKLLHYNLFKEAVEECTEMTEDCINICLQTLHSQQRIGLEYREVNKRREIHLIKIPPKTDANIVITDADRAIHNLEMTRKNLLTQLEKLEVEIKGNEEKAREFVKDRKRTLAKTYLRKKQMQEKNFERRSVALHNIETLLANVEEAQSNGEILDAYKIGSKALQFALSGSGLKYDNVDEIITEVRDTLDTHKEVQDVLSNSTLGDPSLGMSFSNEELERELRELANEYEFPRPTPPPAAFNTPVASNTPKAPVPAANQTIEIDEEKLYAIMEQLEVEARSLSSGSVASEAPLPG